MDLDSKLLDQEYKRETLGHTDKNKLCRACAGNHVLNINHKGTERK